MVLPNGQYTIQNDKSTLYLTAYSNSANSWLAMSKEPSVFDVSGEEGKGHKLKVVTFVKTDSAAPESHSFLGASYINSQGYNPLELVPNTPAVFFYFTADGDHFTMWQDNRLVIDDNLMPNDDASKAASFNIKAPEKEEDGMKTWMKVLIGVGAVLLFALAMFMIFVKR